MMLKRLKTATSTQRAVWERRLPLLDANLSCTTHDHFDQRFAGSGDGGGSARHASDILGAKGWLLRTGTVVDATLIAAPSWTKNADGERDPEMHQAKKGNNRSLGMQAHIGVDAQSGLVHAVAGTATNVNDLNMAGALLHGDEQAASGDAGYQPPRRRQPAAARAPDGARRPASPPGVPRGVLERWRRKWRSGGGGTLMQASDGIQR